MSHTTTKSEDDTSKEDEQLIENASKLLVKLLRYEPDEYDISLNDRGWASAKTIRQIFKQELDYNWQTSPAQILQKVLDNDTENRFQAQSDTSPYMFVRATRGHDTESVSLYDVDPNSDDLSWYLAEAVSHSSYVEATSEEVALQVLQESDSPVWFNEEDVTIQPCDKPSITRGSERDDLSNGPYQACFQTARKPYRVEKQANQGGDKGRYIYRQSGRAIDRIRPNVDHEQAFTQLTNEELKQKHRNKN